MNIISLDCAMKTDNVFRNFFIENNIKCKKCYHYTACNFEIIDHNILSSEFTLLAPDMDELKKCADALKINIDEKDIDEYAIKLADHIKRR